MAITQCQLCGSLKKPEDITKSIVSAIFRNIGRKINPDNSICKRCITINLKWFKYMNEIKETVDKVDVSQTHRLLSGTTDAQQTNDQKKNEYKIFRERLKKNFSCMNEGYLNLYDNLEGNENEKDNKKPRKKHKECNEKETEMVDENSTTLNTSFNPTSVNVQAKRSDITHNRDDIVTIVKEEEESDQHLNDQIPKENDILTCGSCLVTCTGKAAFDAHLSSVEHLTVTEDDGKDTKSLYTCGGCYKQFKKSNLKHMRRCLNLSKERICSVCLEILGDMGALKTHRETHKKYTCKVCSESFSTVRSLKEHKRGVHSKIVTDSQQKILPHMLSCQFCGKEYLKQGMLNNHLLKSHPYCCDLCLSSYSCSGNLYRHLRSMHMRNTDINSTTMIKCEYCGGRFQNKQCLDAHKCTGNPRYRCRRCKVSFNSILCYHKHKERCGRLKSVPLTHQQSSQNSSQRNIISKIQNRTTKRKVFRKRETIAKNSVKLIDKKMVNERNRGNITIKGNIKTNENGTLNKTIENITKPLNEFEDIEFLGVVKSGLKVKRAPDNAVKKRVDKSDKLSPRVREKSLPKKEPTLKNGLNKSLIKEVNSKKIKRIDECENCKNIFTSEDLIRHLPLCIRFEIITDDEDTYRKCERCSMLFSSLPEIHEHSVKCKCKPTSPRQDVRVNGDSSTYDQYPKSKNKSPFSRPEMQINEEPEVSSTEEYPRSDNKPSAPRKETRQNNGPWPMYSKYSPKSYGNQIQNRWNERSPFSSNINRERKIPGLVPYNTFYRPFYGSHSHKNSYPSSYRRDYRF